MAYCTTDDIEDRLGRSLDESESRIVETRLSDLEAMILHRTPTLPDRVAADPMLARTLVMVEADAVMRLIRNPDGKSGETDGNYSYQVDARVASGRLELTSDEWDLLLASSGKVAVLSIALGRTGRQEGEIDPSRGLSGPQTASFESGLWTNNEGMWA